MSVELDYSYVAASALEPVGGEPRLSLATSGGSTPAGRVAHPRFFSGFVEHPVAVAQSLLAIARVARTRFYVPPGALPAVLRAADPVVTSTPEGLRFESFSACCGVYARLDVDAAALDASFTGVGVTNVDVNPPLRQALARLLASEPLHLDVGDDDLRVTTLDGAVVEEKVALPTRWLKGLAETQVLAAAMTEQFALDAAEARRFVTGLPRSSATRAVLWATVAGRGVRLASRPSPGSACVAGPERLRAFGPALDAGSAPTASVWILDVPGGRVTLALSPEKSRGFSGEGAVLTALAAADVAEDADLVSALLAFEPVIDVDRLAGASGTSGERVLGALALLASWGQVGFDSDAGAYFHRPLPVRPELLDELHPRLSDARALVAAGAVERTADGWTVRSGEATYRVTLGVGASGDRCTCPWWAKYAGTRGPCKHVLAVRVATGEQ